MIRLREGEYIVAAYCDPSGFTHYAMTNLGILWFRNGKGFWSVA